MKIAIVQFPGSNCERETMLAVKRAGMEPVEFLWNEPVEKLNEMAGFIIVGGFSYEDRSRAGVIAALDPVMQEIKKQSELGKPVLGICNGAQILVETGLVPGLENNKLAMVLAENKRMAHGKILGTGFYNAWVHMRLSDQYQRNAFTRHLTPKKILHIPVAHGEGRFILSNALLTEVEMQGLNVFQYCDENGVIDEHFPVNPNGSTGNMAAISNKAGNVMAMMPHPERTSNGDAIFQSMRDYIQEGRFEKTIPLNYYPRKITAPNYQKSDNAYECVVELMITDNHALTVQNTLRQLGLPVTVKRYVHWEIESNDSENVEKVKESGVLFNPRKEIVRKTELADDKAGEMLACLADRLAQGCVSRSQEQFRPQNKQASSRPTSSLTLLIRPKDDIVGSQKHQTIQDHFNIKNINAIKHATLWQFTCDDDNIKDLSNRILETNIVANPYAHDCYHYPQQLS